MVAFRGLILSVHLWLFNKLCGQAKNFRIISFSSSILSLCSVFWLGYSFGPLTAASQSQIPGMKA